MTIRLTVVEARRLGIVPPAVTCYQVKRALLALGKAKQQPPSGIFIYGHTARLNELMGNWKKAARLKKRDRAMVMAAVSEAGNASLQRPNGKRRVRLTVVMAPGKRCPDPDCWQKSLGDALVRAGLLIDDNANGVEWDPVKYERGARASMRIVLEDI